MLYDPRDANRVRAPGNAPFTLTDGLHTYFRVGDIHQTRVHGLDGTTYLDKTRDFQQFTLNGPVTFSEETDRVYINTAADCLIEDPVFGRTIRVAKLGNSSTASCGTRGARRKKALPTWRPGEYADMVCVATVNASPDGITIQPGGKHSLVAFVGVE